MIDISKESIDLFIPGRLCLFGEHSDWAGKYRTLNNNIVAGEAIVTGIEEGIYATVKRSKKMVISSSLDNSYFECELNKKELNNIINEGKYYSYICGVVLYMIENYNIGGLEVNIYKQTLPVKKGLSSSAAICVLVARAFNLLYNLQMTLIGEMQVAYYGELKTPSRCGRLDQACAFGINPVSMVFDGDDVFINNLKVGGDFYFVFADLNGQKNTVKILSDLHKCFPFPESEIENNVHLALGKTNAEIIQKAKLYLEKGDSKKLGELMSYSQDVFDRLIVPASPKELESPIFHKVKDDKNIQNLIYGIKGVGSHGDGCVQFLAKDYSSQIELMDYLENKLMMSAYKLTLSNKEKIKKAIIPLAGYATRLFPVSKVIPKAFLPVVDNDGIMKPCIMLLLEELDRAKIEEIGLVINKSDKELYERFFDNHDYIHLKNVPENIISYSKKISSIGKKIKYIYQEERKGLGHALYMCEQFIANEPFLMLLGDQLYKTSSSQSCIEQAIQNFYLTKKTTVSLCKTKIEEVTNYGIATGKFVGDNDYINITKIVEKPSIEYAQNHLETIYKNEKNYYSMFGIYMFKPNIFDALNYLITNNILSNKGEYDLTTAIEIVREKEGVNGFIPCGKYYDIGNVKSYVETFKNF